MIFFDATKATKMQMEEHNKALQGYFKAVQILTEEEYIFKSKNSEA